MRSIERRPGRAAILTLAASLAVTMLTGGCARGDKRDQAGPRQARPAPAGQADKAAPGKTQPKETKQVTLFFGDRQAMHVIPEGRQVAPGDQPLGRVLVRELIRGPLDPFLVPTMPRGTRLLSYEVRNGVARVDFSREFRDNHPGGTAGEAMTLNALVFSLTELDDVRQVQVLVEGREGDTLGHVVFDRPLERGPIRTHQVYVDPERQAWLQGRVDASQDAWRLAPLEVARREGRMAGFLLSDTFRVVGIEDAPASPETPPGAKAAVVMASHGGRDFEILLVQPVRQGPRGIWAVESIREK